MSNRSDCSAVHSARGNTDVASGNTGFPPLYTAARTAHGRYTTPATSVAITDLQDNGLVDRLGRGRYVIRPLGSLHTSTTTDDLALAVGATFGDRQHRIAYLSALADLGLLSHPVRTITVACTTQVRVPAISRRPLRVEGAQAEGDAQDAREVGVLHDVVVVVGGGGGGGGGPQAMTTTATPTTRSPTPDALRARALLNANL